MKFGMMYEIQIPEPQNQKTWLNRYHKFIIHGGRAININ